MTAVVGILCSNGAVIGTDSSTTFTQGQFRTIEQPSEKIVIIDSRIIIAGTGCIGLGQRFCHIVEQLWSSQNFKGSAIDIVTRLSEMTVKNFQSTCAPQMGYGALMAFPLKNQIHLCEFELGHFQPELKERVWYCSMGSGQAITDPFLGFMRQIFWQTGRPDVYDGIFAVLWALEQAIELNPGGINGPARIAVLEKRNGSLSARILDDLELDEHRQNINEAQDQLRNFRKNQQSETSETLPPPPKI